MSQRVPFFNVFTRTVNIVDIEAPSISFKSYNSSFVEFGINNIDLSYEAINYDANTDLFNEEINNILFDFSTF